MGDDDDDGEFELREPAFEAPRWKYPINNEMPFEMGILPMPYDAVRGGERERVQKSFIPLFPQSYEAKPKMERRGNEYVLGAEVLEFIERETIEELSRERRWSSRLGVHNIGGGRTDAVMISRPSEEGQLRTLGLLVESCVPLEGTEGETVVAAMQVLGKMKHTHPIQKIVCDFGGGGMIALEDYAFTAYWPEEDRLKRQWSRTTRRMPIDAAISPFRRHTALAFEDGSLVLFDEEGQARRQLKPNNKDSRYDNVEWGGMAHVLVAGHNDRSASSSLRIVDLRCKEPTQLVVSSPMAIRTMSKFNDDDGVIVLGGDGLLCVYDWRRLTEPAVRIGSSLLGPRTYSFIDWVDTEQLCAFSTTAASSEIQMINDWNTGRPMVETTMVEQPIQGIVCAPSIPDTPHTVARIFCLFEGGRVGAWTAEELGRQETIGRRPPSFLNYVIPTPVYSHDDFLRGKIENANIT